MCATTLRNQRIYETMQSYIVVYRAGVAPSLKRNSDWKLVDLHS